MVQLIIDAHVAALADVPNSSDDASVVFAKPSTHRRGNHSHGDRRRLPYRAPSKSAKAESNHTAKMQQPSSCTPADTVVLPTVRVIMQSGVVHAVGQSDGKERQIPFQNVSFG